MTHRMYFLMCPTGPTTFEIPPILDQIRAARQYRPSWRPPQECTFTLRPLADGEERQNLPDHYRAFRWPDPWRNDFLISSEANARALTQEYRCAEHNLPPRVFRQDHAYQVNRMNRPQQLRVIRVRTSQAQPDPRVPWPEEMADYHAGVYVYVRERPPAHSTHRLWPST